MDTLETGHIHVLGLAAEADQLPAHVPLGLVRVTRQPARLVRPPNLAPEDCADLGKRRGGGNGESVPGGTGGEPPRHDPAGEEALADAVAGRDGNAAMKAQGFGDGALARPEMLPEALSDEADRIVGILVGLLARGFRVTPPGEFSLSRCRQRPALLRRQGCEGRIGDRHRPPPPQQRQPALATPLRSSPPGSRSAPARHSYR